MSAPNITLPDDEPASKDKGPVSPRVGIIPKRPHKPRSPEYSSTPTLSVSRSSSTSGINSVSRSTDSDPEIATRMRLRRAKATSSTINNENYEDRAYESLATSPQDAEDSEEDTQSEPTPLMEGGSADIPMVDIPMADGPEDDNRGEREGGDFTTKLFVICIVGGAFTIAVPLVVLACLYFSDVLPQIPFNTTEIDTDKIYMD